MTSTSLICSHNFNRRQLPERVDPTPQNFNSLTLTTTTTPNKDTGFKGVFDRRFKGVLSEIRNFNNNFYFPSNKLYEMSIIIYLQTPTTPLPHLPYTGFKGVLQCEI